MSPFFKTREKENRNTGSVSRFLKRMEHADSFREHFELGKVCRCRLNESVVLRVSLISLH